MADTPVAITQLVPGTEGIDLIGGGTAISTGNTAVITISSGAGETGLALIIEETGSTTATLSVLAGAYPPAATSGKGADSISLAANDLRLYVPEAGRHINAGTIRILVTGAVKITAYRMPVGY